MMILCCKTAHLLCNFVVQIYCANLLCNLQRAARASGAADGMIELLQVIYTEN